MEDNQLGLDSAIKQNQKEPIINEEMDRKQQFLKTHVQDVYGQNEAKLEQFTNLFMLEFQKRKLAQNPQGLNYLSFISFQELKKIVFIFQQNQKMGLNPENPPQQIPKVIDMPEPQPFKVQKVYYRNGAWDYQLIGKERCAQTKQYFGKGLESPKIYLTNQFTKKNGWFFGMGGKLQLWTTVQNNLTQQAVQRKIQDFIFLKQILTKCFPHTFIPLLSITEDQLYQVNQKSVQKSILQRCQIFLTDVCNNRLLLQNRFTYRFFKQLKYECYINHKKQSEKYVFDNLKKVEDIRQKVPIQISAVNQKLKKDYAQLSRYLQKLYRNSSLRNNKLSGLLSEISKCLQQQTKDYKQFIIMLTNKNVNNLSNSYGDMLNVMLSCKEMLQVYSRNFKQYQSIFDNFNQKLAIDSQKKWQAFTKYSSQFKQKDLSYKDLRKAFLQKDISNNQGAQTTPHFQTKTQNKIVYTVNQSVILEPEYIEKQEADWIRQHSKWQAYMNSQFIRCFQDLINSNVSTFSELLRQSAIIMLQFHQQNIRQSQAVIKNMSCIL